MIFAKVFVSCCLIAVVSAGGESICEPFQSRFMDFLDKFYASVGERKQVMLDNIQTFPFYANASVYEATAVADSFFNFFINVTANLSNLETAIIIGVVNGTITQTPHPLSCVDGVFNIISNFIYDTFHFTLNANIDPTSSSSPSPSFNCTDINNVIPAVLAQIKTIINQRKQLINSETLTFGEFLDQLIAMHREQNDAQFTEIVAALANALNLNSAVVAQLIASLDENPSSISSSSSSSSSN